MISESGALDIKNTITHNDRIRLNKTMMLLFKESLKHSSLVILIGTKIKREGLDIVKLKAHDSNISILQITKENKGFPQTIVAIQLKKEKNGEKLQENHLEPADF